MNTLINSVNSLILMSLCGWLVATHTRVMAQPVDTQAQAVRIGTGMETVPQDTRDANGVRRSDYRTLLSVDYRLYPDFDIGIDTPSITVAPDVEIANPRIALAYHLTHQPVWMALSLVEELPAFVDTGWRSDLYHSMVIPFANNLFEYYNVMGGRLIAATPDESYVSWQGAVVCNVLSELAIGPQAYLRFDKDGLDNHGYGARIRWHIKASDKTVAAVFLRFTTPNIYFNPDTLNATLTATWFWYP